MLTSFPKISYAQIPSDHPDHPATNLMIEPNGSRFNVYQYDHRNGILKEETGVPSVEVFDSIDELAEYVGATPGNILGKTFVYNSRTLNESLGIDTENFVPFEVNGLSPEELYAHFSKFDNSDELQQRVGSLVESNILFHNKLQSKTALQSAKKILGSQPIVGADEVKQHLLFVKEQIESDDNKEEYEIEEALAELKSVAGSVFENLILKGHSSEVENPKIVEELISSLPYSENISYFSDQASFEAEVSAQERIANTNHIVGIDDIFEAIGIEINGVITDRDYNDIVKNPKLIENFVVDGRSASEILEGIYLTDNPLLEGQQYFHISPIPTSSLYAGFNKGHDSSAFTPVWPVLHENSGEGKTMLFTNNSGFDEFNRDDVTFYSQPFPRYINIRASEDDRLYTSESEGKFQVVLEKTINGTAHTFNLNLFDDELDAEVYQKIVSEKISSEHNVMFAIDTQNLGRSYSLMLLGIDGKIVPVDENLNDDSQFYYEETRSGLYSMVDSRGAVKSVNMPLGDIAQDAMLQFNSYESELLNGANKEVALAMINETISSVTPEMLTQDADIFVQLMQSIAHEDFPRESMESPSPVLHSQGFEDEHDDRLESAPQNIDGTKGLEGSVEATHGDKVKDSDENVNIDQNSLSHTRLLIELADSIPKSINGNRIDISHRLLKGVFETLQSMSEGEREGCFDVFTDHRNGAIRSSEDFTKYLDSGEYEGKSVSFNNSAIKSLVETQLSSEYSNILAKHSEIVDKVGFGKVSASFEDHKDLILLTESYLDTDYETGDISRLEALSMDLQESGLKNGVPTSPANHQLFEMDMFYESESQNAM